MISICTGTMILLTLAKLHKIHSLFYDSEEHVDHGNKIRIKPEELQDRDLTEDQLTHLALSSVRATLGAWLL